MNLSVTVTQVYIVESVCHGHPRANDQVVTVIERVLDCFKEVFNLIYKLCHLV